MAKAVASGFNREERKGFVSPPPCHHVTVVTAPACSVMVCTSLALVLASARVATRQLITRLFGSGGMTAQVRTAMLLRVIH